MRKFKKMKGGKNMLYFYCCDVYAEDKKTTEVYGGIECSERITTIEELEKIQSKVRYKIYKDYFQKSHWHIEDIRIIFIAFNPL